MLAATAALADDAWKWTDADGVIHYSDVPIDGAEKVSITEYSRNSHNQPSRNNTPANPSSETQSSQPAPRYETLTISAPGPEETLWNIEGVLNVSVTVSPGLQSGHRVRAYLDGKALPDPSGTSFQVEEVFRGVHNLQVEVIDATGKLMIRSQPNRFYVQQNTVR